MLWLIRALSINNGLICCGISSIFGDVVCVVSQLVYVVCMFVICCEYVVVCSRQVMCVLCSSS